MWRRDQGSAEVWGGEMWTGVRLDTPRPLPSPRTLQIQTHPTWCLRSFFSPFSSSTPPPTWSLLGPPCLKGLPFLQAPGRTPKCPLSLSNPSTTPPACPGHSPPQRPGSGYVHSPDPVPASYPASEVPTSPQSVPPRPPPAPRLTPQGLSAPGVDPALCLLTTLTNSRCP